MKVCIDILLQLGQQLDHVCGFHKNSLFAVGEIELLETAKPFSDFHPISKNIRNKPSMDLPDLGEIC